MAEGTGNGRFVILVVEDDAAVRNLLTMILDLQGYRVEYADRGSAGLMAAASLVSMFTWRMWLYSITFRLPRA